MGAKSRKSNSVSPSAKPLTGWRRTGLLLAALAMLIGLVWWLDGVGLWIRSYAQRALSRSDPISALNWIERAMQNNPEDAAAHLLSARALLQMNMPVAAREALATAEMHGAGGQEVSTMQTVIAAQAGDMAAAEQLMNWSGEQPLPPEAYEAIVRAAEFHGQLSKAELILAQLEQAGQMPGVVLYHRGRIEELKENYTAAADWYSQSASGPTSMPRAAFRAGVCYYKVRAFDQAEAMFRRAAEDPYRIIANIEVARCLWEQGELAEADRTIAPTLAFAPRQLQPFYLQVDEYADTDRAALVSARIEDEKGNAAVAVELLERALAYNHREFEARSLLIKNLKLLGRNTEADRIAVIHSQFVSQRQRVNQLRLELLDHPGDIGRMLELAELLWTTESDAEALLMIDEVLAFESRSARAVELRAAILAN